MTLKHVITYTLFAFVVVSIGYMLLGKHTAGGTSSQVSEGVAPRRADRTDIFYFHGTTRCFTCRMIEDYTTKAVTEHFADELRGGDVALQSVNVESPENRHYIDDFQLSTRTVVVVDVQADTVRNWEALDQVWHLVGDSLTFSDYIRDEIVAFRDE
jgi:hypothetical protein